MSVERFLKRIKNLLQIVTKIESKWFVDWDFVSQRRIRLELIFFAGICFI